MRNLGVPIAHSIISYKAIIKGLNKLTVNTKKINNDLNDNWAIIAEAIQTILRKEGVQNPYELLKKLTRNNNKIQKKDIEQFIKSIDIPKRIKTDLLKISPENYTGKS